VPVQTALTVQHSTVPHYLMLYAPALDWVLSCLAHQAGESLLDAVLQRCANMSTGNALLLNSVMASFRPAFIASRAVELSRRIRDMDDVGFPRHLLYCSLGHCVAAAEPPDNEKLILLNEVSRNDNKDRKQTTATCSRLLVVVIRLLAYLLRSYLPLSQISAELGDCLRVYHLNI